MKKPIRKLAVASETLRKLRADELVAGGYRPTQARSCNTDCELPTIVPGCRL